MIYDLLPSQTGFALRPFLPLVVHIRGLNPSSWPVATLAHVVGVEWIKGSLSYEYLSQEML